MDEVLGLLREHAAVRGRQREFDAGSGQSVRADGRPRRATLFVPIGVMQG